MAAWLHVRARGTCCTHHPLSPAAAAPARLSGPCHLLTPPPLVPGPTPHVHPLPWPAVWPSRARVHYSAAGSIGGPRSTRKESLVWSGRSQHSSAPRSCPQHKSRHTRRLPWSLSSLGSRRRRRTQRGITTPQRPPNGQQPTANSRRSTVDGRRSSCSCVVGPSQILYHMSHWLAGWVGQAAGRLQTS